MFSVSVSSFWSVQVILELSACSPWNRFSNCMSGLSIFFTKFKHFFPWHIFVDTCFDVCCGIVLWTQHCHLLGYDIFLKMSDIQFCILFCSPNVIWFCKSIIPSRLFFSWLSPHHFSSFLLCQTYLYHTATSNLSLTFSNHVLLNPSFNLLCSWPFPLTRVQMCN